MKHLKIMWGDPVLLAQCDSEEPPIRSRHYKTYESRPVREARKRVAYERVRRKAGSHAPCRRCGKVLLCLEQRREHRMLCASCRRGG